MTAPTLPLANKLTDETCNKRTQNRELAAQFGRGFKQTAPDGLNTEVAVWDLSYAPLQGTELATVRAFFTSVKTSTWFTWTQFGDSASLKWKVVKDSVKEKPASTELVTITFSIEQAFDLGT